MKESGTKNLDNVSRFSIMSLNKVLDNVTQPGSWFPSVTQQGSWFKFNKPIAVFGM